MRARSLALLFLINTACGGGIELAHWELSASGLAPQPVELPAHVQARLPDRRGPFRLKTTVALEESLRGRPLALSIVMFHAQATLTANGRPVARSDGDNRNFYRGVDYPLWVVPAELTNAKQLELVLDVENSWVQSTWLDTVPRLSIDPSGDLGHRFIRRFNRMTAYGAVSITLVLALVYVFLYFGDRWRGAHLWLALEGAASALYPAMYLELLDGLGHWDAPVVAIALALSITASVHFTSAQFELGARSRLWDGLLFGCVIVGLIWNGPFEATDTVSVVAVCTVVANVGYQLYVNTRLWRRGGDARVNAMMLMLSWAAMGALGCADLYAWAAGGEIFGGLRPACLGIICIAVLQALVLSREHTIALMRARSLNAELAARIEMLEKKNREVEVLNEELRRQIGARAEDLSSMFARVNAGGPTPRSLDIGEIVEGRYLVKRAIGEGGMSRVYEVTRVADGKPFALKLLAKAASGTDFARFAREAQLIAKFTHPNVVSVVDIDVSKTGQLFIVMELVPGRSLRHFSAHFPNREWCYTLFEQIASGLAAVHEQGIVHRDLKPGNILVMTTANPNRPLVKIADFGVSAGPGTAEEDTLVDPPGELTETGLFVGTPRYMAPELARMGSRVARAPADIFSLGVIAYELLGMVVAFSAQDGLARMRGAPYQRPAPLVSMPRDLDPMIATLIDRCLLADPEKRPTAHELAIAFACAREDLLAPDPSAGSGTEDAQRFQ
jgi:hypothetical protein